MHEDLLNLLFAHLIFEGGIPLDMPEDQLDLLFVHLIFERGIPLEMHEVQVAFERLPGSVEFARFPPLLKTGGSPNSRGKCV